MKKVVLAISIILGVVLLTAFCGGEDSTPRRETSVRLVEYHWEYLDSIYQIQGTSRFEGSYYDPDIFEHPINLYIEESLFPEFDYHLQNYKNMDIELDYDLVQDLSRNWGIAIIEYEDTTFYQILKVDNYLNWWEDDYE